MKRSASDKMTSKRGPKKQQLKRNVVASLDPVLKDLHAKLMGIINDSHKRLVAAVEEELRKAKVNIDRQRKQQLSEGDDDGDGDNDGQDGDGDNDGKASYEDEATVGTSITISEFLGESATTEGGTNEGQQSIGSHPVEQKDAPWRSQRSKKPKNK